MATMYATTKEMTNGTFAYYFDDGETHGAVDGFTSHEEAAKALFAKYPHAELGNQAAFNNMYNELRNKRILASYAAEKAAKIETPAAAPEQAQPEWTPAIGQRVIVLKGMMAECEGVIVGLHKDEAQVHLDETKRGDFHWFEITKLGKAAQIETATPVPTQPAESEIETLTPAMEIELLRWKVDRLEYHLREVKRILEEEVSWLQASHIRDLMEDLEL